MKIYTLGTSHGATEEGRSCSVNLLEVDGAFYLFDCGGDAESKLKNIGIAPNAPRAIFISHMHIDHVASIAGMAKRYMLHYNKTDAKADVFLPEKEAIEPLNAWLRATHFSFDRADAFKLQPYSEGVIYRDDRVTVTAIATKHIQGGKFPSYAFMVEGEGKRFLYTGDLAPSFVDYPSVVYERDFDLILSELVHFDVQKNLPDIARSRTKKLVFTHMSLKNIPVINEKMSELPFPTFVASDGDVYEF